MTDKLNRNIGLRQKSFSWELCSLQCSPAFPRQVGMEFFLRWAMMEVSMNKGEGWCHVLLMFRGSAIWWDIKVVGPSKFRWNKDGNPDFSTIYLGGGFKYFLFSTLFGEDLHFDSYFSEGLKPPTSYGLWTIEIIWNHWVYGIIWHQKRPNDFVFIAAVRVSWTPLVCSVLARFGRGKA